MHSRFTPLHVGPAPGPYLAAALRTWTAVPSALFPLPAFTVLQNQEPEQLSAIMSGHYSLQMAATHVNFVYGI